MRAIVFICAMTLAMTIARAQELIELKQPNSAKITVKLMFDNGSITDPEGMEGLTYTAAQWIADGGTESMTKSEIDNFIYPMAAGYRVSVDKEAVVFTFSFPSDFEDEFFPVMRDLIVSPRFDTSDYQRVMARQENYVTRVIKNSSDEDYSKMILEQYLFEGTSYAHMVEGNASSMKNINAEAAKLHYKNYFTKDNVLVGIAGNYSDDLKQKLMEAVKQLPAMTVQLPEPKDAPMPDGFQFKIVSKPGAFGSAIFMGYPLDITRADDQFAALAIANSYLGEHRKSYGVLYSKIRETRSMNYGDYSYIEWYPDGSSHQLPISGYPRKANYFAMWIRPVQIASGLKQQYPELKDITIGHAHFAIRLAIRELDSLITNGMSKENFELTRDFLRSYIKLYVKTPDERLGYLMDSRFYGRGDWIKEFDNLLAKTTVTDVNKAIREHFQVKNMKVTIITSPDEAEPLANSIRNNLPSPMSYSDLLKAELPKEVLEEDNVIAKYPLNVTSVEVIPSADTFK